MTSETDSLADRLLDEQWRSVRAYQGIDERSANVVFQADLDAALEAATGSIEPLEPWEALPARQFDSFQVGVELVRLSRIMSMIQDGDRVMEIGTGRGYMTGLMLRDREISHYCGVDINPVLIDSVREMAMVNSLDLSEHHLEPKNLFDLTPEFVAEHTPDVVLLLEVVEHVHDPQAALSTVVDALEDETLLVFSVPLLGRIEACWGHVSLFDDVQIRALCHGAGLQIHNVEVVQNHWVLVVAGRGAITEDRRAMLRDRLRSDAAGMEVEDLSIRKVSLKGNPSLQFEAPNPAELRASGGSNGAVITVQGGRGGIVMPTPDARMVRLELGFADGWKPGKVWVRQYAADGTILRSWFWDALGPRPKRDLLTHVFRPGVPSRGFHPIGPVREGAVATTAVLVQPAGSEPSSLRVRRAAHVGGRVELRAASALRGLVGS